MFIIIRIFNFIIGRHKHITPQEYVREGRKVIFKYIYSLFISGKRFTI